jgi:hypothetical protein
MIPAICNSGRLDCGSKDAGENAILEQEQMKAYPDTSDYSITLDRDNR